MPTRQRGVNAVNGLIARLQDPSADALPLRALLEAGENPNLRAGRDGTPLEYITHHFGTVGRPWGDDELEPIYDEFFARPDLDFENETDAGYDSLYILRGSLAMFPKLVCRVEAYVLAHTGTLPPDPRPGVEAELRLLRQRFGLPQPTGLEPGVSAAPKEPKGPQYDAQYCASLAEFFELHPELRKGLKKFRKETTQALVGALWNRVMPSTGRVEFVRDLLARGANPNHGRPLSPFGHSTASLHVAARGLQGRDPEGEAAVFGLLLDAGADPNCYAMTDGTPLETVISRADSCGIPEPDLEQIYEVFFDRADLDLKGGLGPDGSNALIRLRAEAAQHPLLRTYLARFD